MRPAWPADLHPLRDENLGLDSPRPKDKLLQSLSSFRSIAFSGPAHTAGMDPIAELLRPAEVEAVPAREASLPLPLGQAGAAATGVEGVAGAAVEWPSLLSLKVCAVGLTDRERKAFERLVAAPASDMPQLIAVEPARAGAADVVLIDGRTEAAQAWWKRWESDLCRRPVVWIDEQSPFEPHTTVHRPVIWSVLPLILSRAAQVPLPAANAVMASRTHLKPARAWVVVCAKRMAGAQLRWMLESLGHRATVAASAQEGLAALYAAAYDGIILAGGDGTRLDVLDTCRRVRKLERRLGRLPVLVLGNEPSPWHRLQARIWAGGIHTAPWPALAKDLDALLRRYPAKRASSRRERAAA
jgi:CheY-like chemotaxis protein